MSATSIVLTSKTPGAFHVHDLHAESPAQASKWLQLNHERWHILWETKRGMHNHQVHHILTLLALGAPPDRIDAAYEENAGYMRDIGNPSTSIIDASGYESALGKEASYSAYVGFFRDHVQRRGLKRTLEDDLFAENSIHANDLFRRLFDGTLHPFIHLGFGIEFEQPAIIVEALAQAAIHPSRAGGFLSQAEHKSKNLPYMSSHQNLADLFMQAKNDSAISEAHCWSAGTYDRNRDFWSQLPQGLVDIAASYHLQPDMSLDDLMVRIAEYLSVTVWYACAGQRHDKEPKFDFYLMHCVNSSIFHSAFLRRRDLITTAQHIRMLEYTVRMGLMFYICQGAPDLFSTSDILAYERIGGSQLNDWPQVHSAAMKQADDGHIVKFTRALNNAHDMCTALENRPDLEDKFPLRGKEYLKIANMVVDSTRNSHTTLTKWLRGYALPESWDQVPNRTPKIPG